MVEFQGERACTSVCLSWAALVHLMKCSRKHVRHLFVCPIRSIYPGEKYNRRKLGRLDETEKARDEFIFTTLGRNLSGDDQFSGS